MGAVTSHITSLTFVNSTVYSGADQRRHKSSASLAFVWGFPAQMASNAENASIWWRHLANTILSPGVSRANQMVRPVDDYGLNIIDPVCKYPRDIEGCLLDDAHGSWNLVWFGNWTITFILRYDSKLFSYMIRQETSVSYNYNAWHWFKNLVFYEHQTRNEQNTTKHGFVNWRIMTTSSNGNIFHVTDHLCGEFTGHWWISRTKASDAELWCFLWSAPE